MITAMLRFLNEHGLSDGSAVAVPLCGRLSPTVDMRATVEAQIIPRLREALAARLAEAPPTPLARHRSETAPDVAWLADKLVAADDDAIGARVEAARRGGLSLERIYLDWLMPVAIHLTEQLAADLRGLAETTLAFCNLQRLLRHYATEFCAENGQPDSGLRALLVAPTEAGADPGLPVFGLLLMSEFFRREGWDARAERDIKGGSFRDTVLNEWFDLVEVLATSDRDLDAIASGIRLIRSGSPNPSVGVIACGRVFDEHPELVRMIGADRSASDPLSSLSEAKHLVALGPHRRPLS